MHQPEILQNFCRIYGALNKDNLSSLAEIYDPQIEFCDPMHKLKGLQALKDYMATMYQQVQDYSVNVQHICCEAPTAFIEWDIQFRHPQLNGKRLIKVDGVSKIIFSEKIIYHRDYFDVASMLYEHIPVLGGAIRLIKKRLA